MTKLNEKAIELVTKLPKISKTITYSRVSFDFYQNNAIMYKLDGKNINWFFSLAKSDSEILDTRFLKRKKITQRIKNDTCFIDVVYQKNDTKLIQHFEILEDKNYFISCITITGSKTNYLVPMDFGYPASICDELFLSLNEKMILVPYDNDMWVHYESTPLRPGRTSYDVTVIHEDQSNKGLLIGALDFDTWKNGVKCSGWDARCFSAISGIADECTHDIVNHGYIEGPEVKSSRFVCGFYQDKKEALEEYGKLTVNPNGIYHWNHGVPFGWNSYSALTLYTNINHFKKAAEFIKQELPNFKAEDGVTFINFDAIFGISKTQIKKAIKQLHANNQKAGWYMNPLSHLAIQDSVPLKGNTNKHRKDILLKTMDGLNYPTIDGKYPIDITIPEAEEDFRLALREFVEMGFDYLKLDFLSHGAVEGKRHNPNIKTGRQALMYFYNIVKEELDPNKIGREIFISSSIDPLFPCGYSHSRRCSCDAFGHHEDVEYILNALTYSWWTNNSIYQFNDPDHTVLYNSMVDGRGSTSENEAKSRYNASVISGTVMLLSDNFGIDGDQQIINHSIQRAKKFANNEELNKLARRNVAFKPLTISETSNVYYSDNYVAVFNFDNATKEFVINPKEIGFKDIGKLINLNDSTTMDYNGIIKIKLEAYDSAIFKTK